MKLSRLRGACEKVYQLSLPVCEKLGLSLWDVELKKEGPSRFLRISVDKPQGVSISDCEAFHRTVKPLADGLTPAVDYDYFEVTSIGLERRFNRLEHLQAWIGKYLEIKLYEKNEGRAVLVGALTAADEEGITLQLAAEGECRLSYEQIAAIKSQEELETL